MQNQISNEKSNYNCLRIRRNFIRNFKHCRSNFQTFSFPLIQWFIKQMKKIKYFQILYKDFHFNLLTTFVCVFLFFSIYFYQLEANYFTILQCFCHTLTRIHLEESSFLTSDYTTKLQSRQYGIGTKTGIQTN